MTTERLDIPEQRISGLTLNTVSSTGQLERHSVERIYLRQRSFDSSKPRVAAATGAHAHVQYLYVGFSRRNKIPHCSAYDIEESNPVPASGL